MPQAFFHPLRHFRDSLHKNIRSNGCILSTLTGMFISFLSCGMNNGFFLKPSMQAVGQPRRTERKARPMTSKKGTPITKQEFLAMGEDEETAEMLSTFEQGAWNPAPNQARWKHEAEQAATNYLRKDARINVRLSTADLMMLKRRAASEGMPYQTLIASVLHKYVSGSLSG